MSFCPISLELQSRPVMLPRRFFTMSQVIIPVILDSIDVWASRGIFQYIGATDDFSAPSLDTIKRWHSALKSDRFQMTHFVGQLHLIYRHSDCSEKVRLHSL